MATFLPLPFDPGRTAVVLGSSFLGVYAHAGFLNALTDRGFEPARVAGSSAGALAGAFFACGMRGQTLRDFALGASLKWSFVDCGGLWRLPGVLTSLWARGIFSGRNTVRFLCGHLGDRDLAELSLDLAVTNISTARTEIRRSGPLAETVMASCAVPGLFLPQRIGDELFLDGGIAAGSPFFHFLDDDSIDTILIHRIRRPGPGRYRFRVDSLLHAARSSHRLASLELHELRLRQARQHGKQVIEAVTTAPVPGLLSQRLANDCYALGHATGMTFPTPPSSEHQ